MKEAARVQSTIDLYTRVMAGRVPMDAVIRDFMAARRFIGSKDRTAIVERAYRLMRHHARLGWWVERAGLTNLSRNRVLADLVLNEQRGDGDIAALFAGGQYEPEALTDTERTAIVFWNGKSVDDPSMPADVRGECPAWAAEKLHALFGKAFDTHMAAMVVPATLDLRVNTMKGSVEEARASLAADNVIASPMAYSPIGLRVYGKPFMSDSKAYKKGFVEIQDEGSQLIALVTGAKPSMRVLDFCAGGGGKTLVLAAMMENKGNIVAMDNSTKRLEKGKIRYKKAGVPNVETRSLEEEQHRKWLRRQKGTMDVVLVDAPCSSSGTWRRNPDLRWNQYGPTLEEIIVMQAEILDRVADKVKPGGRLVYATCSLFREENEDQIASFLSRHPDYKILPLKQAWEGDPDRIPNDGDFLRLYPAAHGTDGFFAAILQKQ